MFPHGNRKRCEPGRDLPLDRKGAVAKSMTYFITFSCYGAHIYTATNRDQ
jgi:hypothetical protein